VWNKRGRHAATVAVSLLLTLGAAELVVRATGLAQPAWVQPDPVLGWSNRPDAPYTHRGEGASSGRINSRGLRDVEHELVKQPGTYRILVLGDSFSEAFQVPLEQSYPRILEARLNALPDVGPVEVINMSRSGMGTSQQRAWFLSEGRRYDPDLVLLQTYLNDPVDNSPELGGREDVPYYRLDGSDLVLDDAFRRSTAYRLRAVASKIRSKSALIEMFWQGARRSLVSLPQDIRQRSLGSLPPDALENEYLAKPPPAWQSALALTDAVFGSLAADVRRSGAHLLVFAATDGIELDPSAHAWATEEGLDLERPEQWWREVSERNGAEFISILDAFRRNARRTGISPHGSGPMSGTGHWNVYGQLWAGEILADRLAPVIRADRLSGRGKATPIRASANTQ